MRQCSAAKLGFNQMPFVMHTESAVVRDPSVGTQIRVPTVATPIAPSTDRKYMKYNTNKLTLKLTVTLAQALTLTNPSDTILYVPFS